jgi:hypothetical protein
MANIYNWLKTETAPKILVEAVKLLGIKEVPGQGDNIVILKWAETLGLEKTISPGVDYLLLMFVTWLEKK